MSSDTLASTAEYLGHEGAEVARAAELWQRVARYEANHPVSLKVHLGATLYKTPHVSQWAY